MLLVNVLKHLLIYKIRKVVLEVKVEMKKKVKVEQLEQQQLLLVSKNASFESNGIGIIVQHLLVELNDVVRVNLIRIKNGDLVKIIIRQVVVVIVLFIVKNLVKIIKDVDEEDEVRIDFDNDIFTHEKGRKDKIHVQLVPH